MTYRIALAGNPNCGKTTLFNRLTGASQRVGNWPRVTIDRKEGRIKGYNDATLVDTPGVYSLSPYSPEEKVTRDYLLDEHPDAVINIVDATNLERNLFLSVQIMDMGIPMVVALNMMDEVEKHGDGIDVASLSKRLGCPVIPISALRGTGIGELVDASVEAARSGCIPRPVRFDEDIESVIAAAETRIGVKRFHAVKLLENDELVCGLLPGAREDIIGMITALENDRDDDMDAVIADARYNAIGRITDGCITRAPGAERRSLSDRIDRIVTHRILGLPIFVAVVGAMFVGIMGFGGFTGIGTYFTDMVNDWIGDVFSPAVSEWCTENDVEPILASLLVDGIIAGTGAVLGFIPQMAFLFLALCILEDVGYMARIAFVMDRIFRSFGLSGKSFIPAIVGTGCGVPGILTTRTIENARDRKLTAMTVTFMPCGAKLPVISMIAGALFQNNGLVALYAYLLGIACVLGSGIILKKWRGFAGEPAPFIMELPPYHMPSWTNVARGIFDRCAAFVRKAFTIILLATVAIWFLGSFSTSLEYLDGDVGRSILADIGRCIFGLFQPLGWGDNWELAVGTFTGLIAKENLIATLGTLFGLGDAGESGSDIWHILSACLTPAAGLSFLTFNLLCAPCFAAIGAMHRELGTWKATVCAVSYQCMLAYFVSAIVYVVASAIMGTSADWAGYVAAGMGTVLLAYLLLSGNPFRSASVGGTAE